ncbi:FAD-dependent oxidoreductase [Paraglaciecola sp. Hal342]
MLGAGGITAPLWASGSHRADVIIIGAGLAGLTSARYLKAQGLKVLLLKRASALAGEFKPLIHMAYMLRLEGCKSVRGTV